MEKRINFIDELRGIAVIIMVIFHFIYQENLWTHSMEDLLRNFYLNLFKTFAQIIFISLAGVCCNFSRDNIKRGLLYLYLGLFIHILTYIIVPDNVITFGIFSFMGTAILIYDLFKDVLDKITIKKGLVCFISLFIIFYLIENKIILREYINNNEMISSLIEKGCLNIMGLRSSTFKSSDFFPLFPWIFIFIAGVFGGRKFISERQFSRKRNFKFLSFIGRKSLFIYIIHIPLLLLIIRFIN